MSIVESVEGMMKFFLGAFLSGNKMDIINHKNIYVAVFVPKVNGFTVLNGRNEFVCKFFACHGCNIEIRISLGHIMADGMHKMCLSKPNPPVNEERVVSLHGGIGYG